MTSEVRIIIAALIACTVAGAAGCNASPPKRWASDGGGDLQVALASCHEFAEREFNFYEDFSDPALGSVGVEANLNRRIAYRQMITECMERSGFHLEAASD